MERLKLYIGPVVVFLIVGAILYADNRSTGALRCFAAGGTTYDAFGPTCIRVIHINIKTGERHE